MGAYVKDWRALALGLCTLWGNMLLLDVPGSVLLATPFASRMVSMAFSILGFVAAFLVARRGGSFGCRRGLLAVSCAICCAGSFAHFCSLPFVPGWLDVASVAAFSIFFAFPLVAFGEIYARLPARSAIVYAGLSYFLAWVGCSLVGELPTPLVCLLATVLPALILLFVMQPARIQDDGAGLTPRGLLHTPGVRVRFADGPVGAGRPVNVCSDLLADVQVALRAIPLRVLAALAITYFAIGGTWAQAGSPTDYFSPAMVLVAALASLAVMLVCLALHGRLQLAGIYKVLMVGQVLAAFLLSEWEAPAQAAVVITLVGVKIVAWLIMADLARVSGASGVGTATVVYVMGCLAGHVGEGVSGVIGVLGGVNQSAMLIVVVLLLVIAAAFLFVPGGVSQKERDSTNPAGTSGAGSREAFRGVSGAGDAGSPVREDATTDPAQDDPREARVAELAGAYLLSERETDVFRLWATGHSLKYIQERLCLSQSTVKTHVRHIYDKTGVHSRAEIVALLDESHATVRRGPA